MYLDTDVILASLKDDDWLASSVDVETMATPKTSVATGIEVQFVMEDDWRRDSLADSHREILESGIELIPLTTAVMDAAGELRRGDHRINVFDGVHLGTARTIGEPIVSTDTLYPDLEGVDHIDPREMDE
ncbi:MAG: PIN domain-containing protein [Halapricum sp.]